MSVEPFAVEVETGGEHAGICVLTLEQVGRPVVVLDHDLLRRLEATLSSLPGSLKGLVLRSASRVFVAGADLKSIQDLDDEALDAYLAYGSRVFGMLPKLRYLTVAAVEGAVLGGGLELAMHCDGIVASASVGTSEKPPKPYPWGLPEAGLGLCPGWGGTCLLPARVNPGDAIRRTAIGQTWTSDDGLAFADAVAEPGAAVDVAKAWIMEHSEQGLKSDDGLPRKWIGRDRGVVSEALESTRFELPETEAADAVVTAMDAGLVSGWEAGLASERASLVRLRHTDAAKEALSAFFARSK